MSYSRRQLYALGEPIGDSATYKEGGRTIYGDGGGGGGSSAPPVQNSTGTTYTTNIPEYAAPYVQTMLGAAQRQIFTGGDAASGFQPYVPYSTDPTKYFADFSPMQKQAFETAANLEVPSQYGAATGLAGAAGLGSMGLSGKMATAGADYSRMATDPRSTAAYMSPYMQNVVDYQKAQAARDYGVAAAQRKAQAVGQGAFGGSRQAIQETEAERALMSQLQGIQATGSQQAFQNAQQAQQYAANLGLQGQQGALQGLGQTLSAAGTLGQLGTSELGAQTNIANLQQQYGAQQQANQQQIINQAIQNYATEQQYPFMQLSILNSLLRGLPLQSTTTQSYQAAPSTAQQLTGLGITGLGAYKAMSGFKEGGEVKGYASRGLAAVSGGVEGSVRAKLEMMDDRTLMQVASTSQSAEVRAMAQEVLREHKIREQAEDQARQAIARDQAPKPQIPQTQPEAAGLAAAPAPNMDTVGAAKGGILAFAGDDGSLVEEEDPLAGLDEKTRKIAERQMGLQRAFGVKENIYDPYKQFLTEKAAGLPKEKDYVMGMGLMDVGSRIASTPGPWGSAIAQSIQGALPQFQKGIAEYKKAEADVYKAQTDVAKAENDVAMGRADKTEKAYEALQKEENDFARTKMQVEGNIRAQSISANRPTDLMNNYSIKLNALTNGDPSKATPAQKDAAMAAAAKELRGDPAAKLANAQEQTITARTDKDDRLKAYNEQLSLLNLKKKPTDADLKAIETLEAKIDAREKQIKRDVLRQSQTSTSEAGTSVTPPAPVVNPDGTVTITEGPMKGSYKPDGKGGYIKV